MSSLDLKMSGKEEEAIKELARNKSEADLHYLAKEMLGYDRLTDHCHKDMARDIDTPKYKFKLLLWPRGHFKSTIGTESRCVHKLIRNPNERILITNAKLSNSQKFLRSVSSHFDRTPRFRWAFRDWWIKAYATEQERHARGDKLDWVTRDVADEFTVLRPNKGIREASITTGATDSSLVSQHYSTIIADDLINREYVRSPEGIEKSILYFKDLLDLLDPGGEMLIIGTRWSHVDLYDWLIREFGHKASLRVPPGFVEKSIVSASENTLEENKNWLISVRSCYNAAGEPIFPEEFNRSILESLEKAKGPYEFGAQYLLNPTPDESQSFRQEWFKYYNGIGDLNLNEMTICMTVDPAKSVRDRADNTAMVVCGYDKENRMYLLDGRDEKLTPDLFVEAFFELVRKWYNKGRIMLPVGLEAVGFQELYKYTLERMMRERRFFFMIEPITHRKQSKDERILRLVPRVKNEFYMPKSLLVVPYGGGAPYDLTQRILRQLTLWPFAGHDDIADALSDQMELVPSNVAPRPSAPKEPEPEREFTHPSIIEDRRSRKRMGVR